MENVPEVVGQGNIQHFKKWEQQLREFGYSNYVEILNAKNYGIPQNRRRCFMVSILGDYSYDFPCKIPLKYRLKDLLETNVDEKYYLSDKMIQYISATGTKDFSVNNSEINCSISRPLTTEQNKRAGTTNYIGDDLPENTDLRHCNQVLDLQYYNHEQSNRVYGTNGTSPTIRTGNDDAKAIKIVESQNNDKVNVVGNYGNGHHAKDIVDSSGLSATITTGNHNLGQTILIKNNNEKGFLEAESGDGINICGRMEYQRGNVQKGSSQTLSCRGGNDVGVVVENEKDKT